MLTSYVPSARAPHPAEPDDLCVPVGPDGVYLDGGSRLPALRLLRPIVTDLAPLGAVRGRPVWAVTLPPLPPGQAPEGLHAVGWLACLGQLDQDLTSVVARALAVTAFRRDHRFCGACGCADVADVGWAVARRCPSCGLTVFAKAQPVALVAVWRPTATGGREVLLAQHTYGASHLWALVGGYVDPAESLEQAAHREVAEEVGLEIADLTYFGTEAWGLNGPGVLLATYTARSLDPYAEPVVDGHELAQAAFFPADALPDPLPPQHLIASRALRHAAAGVILPR